MWIEKENKAVLKLLKLYYQFDYYKHQEQVYKNIEYLIAAGS